MTIQVIKFWTKNECRLYLEAAKNVKHTFFRWCSKQIFSPDIQIAAVNKTRTKLEHD